MSLLIQSDLGYTSTWLFGLVLAMAMFSSISSVKFAQSSFISVTKLSLNEQGKKFPTETEVPIF